MKRVIIFIICLSIVESGFSQKDPNQLDEIIEFEKRAYFLKNSINPSTGREYDLKYHRMNWLVDPNINSISGSIYSEFTIVQATSEIDFDLNSNMIVDSVLYHGNQVSANHSNDILKVLLSTTLNTGDFDSIEVYYHGSPNNSISGSWFLSNHGQGPVLSTLSEPYGAKDWWPCKQSLNDKIDSIDIYVETSNQYKVASNGVLVEKIPVLGNSLIYHWKHKYPITTYLIAISVSNYEEFSSFYIDSQGDSLELLNYCYPQSLSQWQSQIQNTIDAMAFFDSLFEDYPFSNEKYGHAEWEWSGGMEHQTMSFMSNLGFGLNSHELAHQWFGDKITCASWEDIWLNEGFATYLYALALEKHINPGISYWEAWKTGAIGLITSEPDGSVKVDDTTDVSRIFSQRLSYNKAAYVLHMLRWVIGEEDFFEGIRNYLGDPNLEFSYANTEDLINHLEQSSSRDLEWFFDDWYEGEGHPIYNVNLSNGTNSDYVLKINQNSSHPSVDFFEMPVEVKFIGLSVDTIIVFHNDFDGQEFSFDLPFEIIDFEFDPGLWICAEVNTTINLEQQVDFEELIIYPNPVDQNLTIIGNSNIGTIVKVEIIDSRGALKQKLMNPQSLEKLELSLGSIESGMYYIKIYLDKSIVKKRIIKS